MDICGAAVRFYSDIFSLHVLCCFPMLPVTADGWHVCDVWSLSGGYEVVSREYNKVRIFPTPLHSLHLPPYTPYIHWQYFGHRLLLHFPSRVYLECTIGSRVHSPRKACLYPVRYALLVRGTSFGQSVYFLLRTTATQKYMLNISTAEGRYTVRYLLRNLREGDSDGTGTTLRAATLVKSWSVGGVGG